MSNNTKRLATFIVLSAGCGLFSYVYEHFSHDVYSNYMVYLFAIPLIIGALPQLILGLCPSLDVGGAWRETLQNYAIATLTIGSLLQGIVEIYGTTSRYIVFYLVVGFGLLAASVALWITALVARRR